MSEASIVPPFEELQRVGRVERLTRDPRLTQDAEGTVNDALNGQGAELARQAIHRSIQRFEAAFVSTARGADLDRKITDLVPSLTRQPATAARVTLTVTRAYYVGGHTIPAGAEVTGRAEDGSVVLFRVDEAVAIGAGDAAVTVAATAASVGRAGNVPAGTLTTIQGLPAGFVVEQPVRASGGADEETDEPYRARFRRYWKALRRGTREAIETGAMQVPGVRYAKVDESHRDYDDGGYVAVYVGDADAFGNTLLAEAVALELAWWASAGIDIRVYGATRDERALTLAIKVRRGANQAQIRADALAAVAAFEDRHGPGDVAYMSRLESDVHLVSPQILRVDVTTPATPEVVPTDPYGAIRFPPGQVTITFTEV